MDEAKWALPFLTVLAPSQRYHQEREMSHKKLTDWAGQMISQVRRWLPDRAADTSICPPATVARRMTITDRRAALLHWVFTLGIWLKGFDGVLEIVGGGLLFVTSPSTLSRFVVALTQHELIEDPHDWLATGLRQTAAQLSVSTQLFSGLYLVVHGLLKLLMVVGLWREYRWAYPLAIGALSLFIAYQTYRLSYQPSLGLLLLTLFDIVIVGLTWREYRQHTT